MKEIKIGNLKLSYVGPHLNLGIAPTIFYFSLDITSLYEMKIVHKNITMGGCEALNHLRKMTTP